MAENHRPDNSPKPILSDPPAAAPAAPDPAAPDSFQPPDTPRRRASDVLGALTTIEAQLAALRQTQADHEQEIATAQEQLAAREHDLKALAATVRDKQAALQKREADLATRESSIAEREQRLDADRRAVESARAALDDRTGTLEARTAEIEARASELAEREAAIQDREQAATDADTLQARVESAHAEIDTLTRELTESSARLDRSAAESESLRDQVAGLTRDCAAASRLGDDARRRAGELEGSVATITQQHDRARAELAEMVRSALSPARVEELVEEGIEKARAEWATAHEATAAAAAEAESLRAKLDDLRAARDAATARAEAAERASIESAQQAAEAEARIRATADRNDGNQAGADPHELAKRDAAIKALRDRMMAAQQDKASLEVKLGEATGELEKLRAQPMQPAPMSGAMAGVSSAAHEQLSEERSKIVKMREAVTERERAINAKAQAIAACASWAKATYTAAALMGCLLVCAGASWVASGRIATPMFNARAALAIDDRERAATPEQLEAWQEYHEKLVLDPQLMDQVASRMRLRGVEALADPSDVHDMLEERLDVAADGAGNISLTLQGRGAQPTERALETLVTSYISLANSTRDMRRDGCGVMVVSPAAADANPVGASGRMNAFLLCFGGSAAVLLLVVFKIASADRSRDRFAREVAPEAVEEHRIDAN